MFTTSTSYEIINEIYYILLLLSTYVGNHLWPKIKTNQCIIFHDLLIIWEIVEHTYINNHSLTMVIINNILYYYTIIPVMVQKSSQILFIFVIEV